MKITQQEYCDLVNQHQGYLYTIIYRKMYDKMNTREVLQECNLRLLSKFHLFSMEGLTKDDLIPRFKGWCAAFAVNSVRHWACMEKRFSKEIQNEDTFNIACETYGEIDRNFIELERADDILEAKNKINIIKKNLSGIDLIIFNEMAKGKSIHTIARERGVSHQRISQIRIRAFGIARKSILKSQKLHEIKHSTLRKTLKNLRRKSRRAQAKENE